MVTDFIVGSPVRDDDFLFREEFVNDLWEALEKHNILLLAPRRIGKTSVMYRLLDYPRMNWMVIHLNVEALKSPSEFLIYLIDALNEHQPDFLRNTLARTWDFLGSILDRIQNVEAFELKLELRKSEKLSSNWQEMANQLMKKIWQTDGNVLFILDEVPDMLNNMYAHSSSEYEIFLHWFRQLRDESLNNRVRWLVGGSVNLTGVLDQQGKIKLINDLKVEILHPFNSEEVRVFVTRNLEERGVEFDDDTIPRIQELLGKPVPVFLQLLTQELYRHWKRKKMKKVTAATVDDVFRTALLGEMARDKLQHYRTRLDLYYQNGEHEAACHILDQLSVSKKGMSRIVLFQLFRQVEDIKPMPRTGPVLQQAFHRLLLNLQSDFYIEEVRDDGFDFASRLLKNWWKKYYGYVFDNQ